jgi:hypothetical protein
VKLPGSVLKLALNLDNMFFTVKVYRDCQGVALGNFTLQTVHNIPGMSSIPLILMKLMIYPHHVIQ